MKILVAYFSETGNTAKVASAISEAVSSRGHEVDLCKVEQVTSAGLDDYDLVYLGTTCHNSDLANPIKSILAQVGESLSFKLAGFVTHATKMPDQGRDAPEMYERWAGKCSRTFEQLSKERAIPLLGYFHCQGAPSPQIEVFIHNTILPDEQAWTQYLADVREHPNNTDLENAREFALWILETY